MDEQIEAEGYSRPRSQDKAELGWNPSVLMESSLPVTSGARGTSPQTSDCPGPYLRAELVTEEQNSKTEPRWPGQNHWYPNRTCSLV